MNKIPLIKQVRAELGIGLKEAKDVVDAAITRFLSDEPNVYGTDALVLVPTDKCLGCGGSFSDHDQGSIFCTASCLDEYRVKVRNSAYRRYLDRKIVEAERELDGLKRERAALATPTGA